MKKHVANIAGIAVLSCVGFLGLGEGSQILQKFDNVNTVAHAASDKSNLKELEKTQTNAKTKGGLSTHVLDQVKGKPAPNIKVKIYEVNKAGELRYLHTKKTNNEGRIETLLSPEELTKGTYEMHFLVGDYFEKHGTKASDEFLDEIPIRFEVTDSKQHYHVPIVVAPGGYSTYHGS